MQTARHSDDALEVVKRAYPFVHIRQVVLISCLVVPYSFVYILACRYADRVWKDHAQLAWEQVIRYPEECRDVVVSQTFPHNALSENPLPRDHMSAMGRDPISMNTRTV